YSLNLKVADEESYASFIVYETVGSKYLNISAEGTKKNLYLLNILKLGFFPTN
ncbi:hypothetical protein HN51_039272, partial [Arachis hypogaea]